ncbi:hypothetical protein D3C74_83880 [compost metagenome]
MCNCRKTSVKGGLASMSYVDRHFSYGIYGGRMDLDKEGSRRYSIRILRERIQGGSYAG